MDHNLLVSELQALSLETKRRNPDVRDASEAALELLKGGQVDRDVLASHAEVLLRPITLGCKTKIAKVIGISIAALQRLVALGGVPTAELQGVLVTLNSVANQAVDIQLKILQTLLSILTFNQDVHDEVLGNALLLCFRMQDSRVSVVSSTAAATLRQAVMLIFDRVFTIPPPSEQSILTLPTDPPTEISASPAAVDAYNIFSDLCLLTATGGTHSGLSASLFGGGEKEKPKLLRLHTLQRTFGLELIESILSGYEEGVKQRPELLFLLRHSLDPLLLKLLAEKPTFPIALRVCRLLFLLIRSFTDQLPAEVEAYLSTLIRLGMSDENEESGRKENTPAWLRVLALEILRGICGDAVLLQNIWAHYDRPEGSKMYSKLVSALSRLVNEKPALLGIGTQMYGLGIPTIDPTSPGSSTAHATGYLDMGLGMVASAASVGVSTVNAMMGSQGAGLGQQSTMKLRLIEQHDKAEAPIIPETYIYLLALQSLDAIAAGIYTSVAQSSDPPPSVHGMASSAWPALLAALSYCIGTNLSDTIFAEVLNALQDFTIACGLLDLNTPRDAFLSTLAKYSVPPPVVSAMQTYMEAPHLQRNSSVMSADALGFSALGVGAPAGPPSLSERNLACLKSTINTARVLAGSLGGAWHDVLEVLQNANFMLAMRKPAIGRRPTGTGASPSATTMTPGLPSRADDAAPNRPDMLNDLDAESIQLLINALFDSSRDLPDEAFTTFVTALCRLSSEMIGLDTTSATPDFGDYSIPSTPTMSLSPSQDGRRRTSGINISHSIKSGERSFSLTKLRIVATINLSRLVTRDQEVGWSVITQHLLAVARHVTAASTIRVQASDTLGELLLSAVRIGKDSRIQHQVFEVLVRQVDVHPVSNTISTDYDVRSAGYQTLNNLLESSGHSLEVGWPTIFGMLNKVCKAQQEPMSQSLSRSDSQTSLSSIHGRSSTYSSKGTANLIRIAFPSLTLICTDFLTSLDSDAMQQCIACLGHFGRQREDVNITLAAIGLLWNVSDAVQAQSQTDDEQSKDLWLYLLTELLELGRDPRLEVRSSAMQTLFRCVELYGTTLSASLWEDVFWKVIFPLLDATQGDESHILALTSVGMIFGSFLTPISGLRTFEKIYGKFLEHIRHAWRYESRQSCTAALKALEKVLLAIKSTSTSTTTEGSTGTMTSTIVDMTWATFTDMGEAVPLGNSYTQDNLIALARVAGLLHDQLSPSDVDRLSQLSTILRATMTYTRSTDFRPDVDVMSPLQSSIVQLVAGSKILPTGTVLSDMAEFASLAFIGLGDATGAGTKVTFVALSKFVMPKLKDVFETSAGDVGLYDDGVVESIIGAYSIPIRLKYDCPPANKFGDDQPLWRTAMNTLVVILDRVLTTLDTQSINAERFEGIWVQVMDVFGGILLADGAEDNPTDETFVLSHLTQLRASLLRRLHNIRIPDRIITQYAEVLRRASTLYHYDVSVPSSGGTTAPAIPESSEELRYWAFDTLITSVSASPSSQSKGKGKEKEKDSGEQGVKGTTEEKQGDKERVARLVVPSLLRRMGEAMKSFLGDKKLRGNLPFARTREEEILYILRHLVTLRLSPGILSSSSASAPISPPLSAVYATSSRAHLFALYPLLLELSFITSYMPSMWIFPSEHALLFSDEDEGDNQSRLEAHTHNSGTAGEPKSEAEAEAENQMAGQGKQDRGGAEPAPPPAQNAEEAATEAGAEAWDMNAGDGGDLIEVNARELARRCLELIGQELGLGQSQTEGQSRSQSQSQGLEC